jgi:hypothetical protein
MGIFDHSDSSASNHTCPNVIFTDPGMPFAPAGLQETSLIFSFSSSPICGKLKLPPIHCDHLRRMYGIFMPSVILLDI